MRTSFKVLAIGLMMLPVIGCSFGPEMVKTQGRVLLSGQPYEREWGQNLVIFFVPVLEPGKLVKDYYYAEVDQDKGTFKAAGKQFAGMPPGKYKVSVELRRDKNDIFKGKYDSENTPFEFEIDRTCPELTIDLDSSLIAPA